MSPRVPPPIRRPLAASFALPLALAGALGGPAAAAAEVPTFAQVSGHDFGQRVTVHHQMAAYLRRLAETSERVTVVEQGRSWEGRALLLAIVTSPANHARLTAIQDGARQLADPRRVRADGLAALLERQPVIAWLGGSIHGFELSGSEALLKLLENLTRGEDQATLAVLDNVVTLIDPMINPDGRDAFAHFNHQRLGHAPDPRREDWGNDVDRWDALRFRTGHYFFDTNRDWFAHTQAETRARWPTIAAWRPQVVIDAHEMGSDVEFYFDPPTEPYGAFFPDYARRGFERFNQAYAEAFDRRGFVYMTGERYNYLYPGYTTSWGSYQGAIGMLYEQGSSRGLAIERPDGSVRRLADALEQQYTAARAALDHAAADRRALLEGYHAAARQAIDEGAEGVRRYLITPGGDPHLVAELVDLLRRNGIEVGVLQQAATLDSVRDRYGRSVGSRAFEAGTWVVETAQPRGRLVRTLLEPDQPLEADFLDGARARLDRGENPRFYDITAWSLPLLFDLTAFSTGDGRGLDVGRLAGAGTQVAAPGNGRAGYAYLHDGRDARALGAMHALLRAGYRAAVTLVDTRIAEEDVPRGTVVLRVGDNDERLYGAVRATAGGDFGVAVRAVDTGLGAPGRPALGSADVVPVRPASIALLAEGPVFGYSFGWAWYTLDRQYRLPVTVLRSGSLRDTDLAPFDTLVLPHLSDGEALATLLGEPGLARLRQWLGDGGTLVAIAGAVDFARDHLGLALRSFYQVEEGEEAPRRFDVPGAFVRAVLDGETWLSVGQAGGELPFLVDSARLYQPPTGSPDPGRRVVARYAQEEPLRIAGHLWPESLERLPGAVAVYEQRVGDGRIVAFAEDVNFRGFWRGADRLFLNAVVLGPSAP